ncbi:YbjN domain-containing protein [Hyphococcus formosus]|uniref:YbjN domain-containing protein n=1 Tax=Hyphococcus formosus TaxID=3143534 RepID=UPI00398B404F
MKSTFAAISTAALIGLSSVSGAYAQNQMGSSGGLQNPSNVVSNFSVQSVGPVLNELGMQWQVKQLDNGKQFIHAISGSMQFVLFFTVCKETGCSGMQAVTFFSNSGANPQTVQAFNVRYPFGTAGVDADGVAYVSRYDIADFGIPRGNIASSLINFIGLAEGFAAELANSHQTVSLDGYANDLASGHLNRQGLASFGVVTRETINGPKGHQIGFEEGAEFISELLKNEATPRNKIENKLD